MASCVIEELSSDDPCDEVVGAPPSVESVPEDQPERHEEAANLDQGSTELSTALLPPDDCEKVTEDGGVLKKILVPGSGPQPHPHARCLVHYVGRLQSDGSVIMDTRAESEGQDPVKREAGKADLPKESGLSLAIATMRPGEVAAVYIQDAAYAYGAEGSFSFPAVPGGARLMYEVELVDFEQEEEEGEEGVAGLLFEERLERAERRRKEGNDLFMQGQYREAMGKYAVALSYMDEDFMMQLEGKYEDQAHAVKVPVHLNMAACQLKIKDYHTAIYNCTQVLAQQPRNAKALFRRGVARHALGQTEQALADLTAAQEIAPEDPALLRELHALRQTMREERQAQKKLYKGQFKPSPGGSSSSQQQEDGSSEAGTSKPGEQQQEPMPEPGKGFRNVVSKLKAPAGVVPHDVLPKQARPQGAVAWVVWLLALLAALPARLLGALRAGGSKGKRRVKA